MKAKTKHQTLRAKTAKQLRDIAREDQESRLDIVLEFSRRYSEAVKRLRVAQQDLADNHNYEITNLVNSLCCILNESEEDWTLDEIVALIRTQSRVDVPTVPVSPIDDVSYAP